MLPSHIISSYVTISHYFLICYHLTLFPHTLPPHIISSYVTTSHYFLICYHLTLFPHMLPSHIILSYVTTSHYFLIRYHLTLFRHMSYLNDCCRHKLDRLSSTHHSSLIVQWSWQGFPEFGCGRGLILVQLKLSNRSNTFDKIKYMIMFCEVNCFLTNKCAWIICRPWLFVNNIHCIEFTKSSR